MSPAHRLILKPRQAAAPLFLLLASLGHSQTLSVQDGLQLWLKADAGVSADGTGAVSAWNDQSPNANHAARITEGMTPTLVPNALNNKPVLRFDGVDDYLEVPDSDSLSILGDMTTFFVVRFDDFITYRAVWAKTDVNFPGPFDWYTLPSSGVPRGFRGNGTNANFASFDGGVPLRANTFLTTGYGIEGEVMTHYLGTQATSSGTLTGFAGDTDKPVIIGSRGDLFTKMKGDIAEILVYDRALDETERAAVGAYLGTKYNIANLPPLITLAVTPAGPTVPQGQTVTLTATASDPDGTVESVEFFANGLPAGTATAPPYSLKVRIDTPGTHTFTARVTDNRSAVTTSAPVTRQATPGAEPSLDVRTNLNLWLRADAGVTTGPNGEVTAWADQSGNNNHAVSADEFTAPTVTPNAVAGRPALHFDGADDVLSVEDSESVSFTGDLTSFFVVKMDDFGTYRAVWSKTLNNQPASVDYYLLPGNGIPRYFRGSGLGGAGNARNIDAPKALRAGVFELAGFGTEGNVMSQYLNGQLNGAGAGVVNLADQDTPLLLGTRADGVTRLAGDLAEVVIYGSALNAADRRSVELYFANKYAIPFTTSANDAPTATLTSPAAGQTLAAPANISVSATAADADGAVARVEFLINGTVAATDTTAPYEAVIPYTVAGAPAVSVRAVDNFGALSAAAALVTVTVTGTTPSPLPAPGNLRLWLRADEAVTQTGGAVTAWGDLSGNVNNAVQPTENKRPALIANELNGKPVLRFDGVDDELMANSSPTLAITGDITSFFVVRFDDFLTFRSVWGKTAAGQPRATDYYMVPNTGISQFYRGGTGGVQAAPSQLAMAAGQFYIAGFDMSETLVHHFLDGGLSGLGTITAAMEDLGNPLFIGSRDDGVTRMKGDIAEVIIYNSALSDTERAQALTYLSTKYGIPVTHITTAAPALSAAVSGGNITLTWPQTVTGWFLESSQTMEAGSWIEQVTDGNTFTEPSGSAWFYRLRLRVQ